VFTPDELIGWARPDNIIEWTTSPGGLNRVIYPRQATILKLWALQDHILTDYDLGVIEEWTSTYLDTADETGEGERGIQPDVLERLHICKQENRPWFRETVSAIGRRGGKGYVGGIKGAYVLWSYMGLGDPHSHFSLARDKKFQFMVYANKREHAQRNQWRDLSNVILGSPCFSPYISRPLEATLTVMAPWDKARMHERWARGIESDQDMATFEILPKEATLMAGRGPASCAIFFDEFAHIVREVAKVEASELYDTSTPSLDQFKEYAFIYQASTTWTRQGQFLENYLRSIQRIDGKPAYPEMFMVILESWDPYEDWERAHEIEMWPGGPKFPRFNSAPQLYDEQARRKERANPSGFNVEYRSRWATVLDSYLNRELVSRAFDPYEGQTLQVQEKGNLGTLYRAHFDASAVGDRFAFAIAHRTPPDERGLPHVVFDLITFFDPGDFDNNEIDFDYVMGRIAAHVDSFVPTDVTHDQFYSRVLRTQLEKHIMGKNYPRQVDVWERTATAKLNWQTWEATKTALHLGLVHAPRLEELESELIFLQRKGKKVQAPTSGPVKTDDLAVTFSTLVHDLLEDVLSAYIGEALSGFSVEAIRADKLSTPVDESDVHDMLSDFGWGASGRRGR
jgi:hypothetical protein